MKITPMSEKAFAKFLRKGRLERRITALENHIQEIAIRHNELYIKYNVLKRLVSPEPETEPEPDVEN